MGNPTLPTEMQPWIIDTDNTSRKRPRNLTESSSSSSSSDSDDEPAQGEEEEDLENLHWVAPPRGMIHIVDDDWIPRCSAKPLTRRNGTETGKGFATARDLGRTWCSGCIKPAGITLAAILMADNQVAEAKQLSVWTDSAAKTMTHVAIMSEGLTSEPINWRLILAFLVGIFFAYAIMTAMKFLTQVNMAIRKKLFGQGPMQSVNMTTQSQLSYTNRVFRQGPMQSVDKATQSQVSYTKSLHLTAQKFMPLADREHGAW